MEGLILYHLGKYEKADYALKVALTLLSPQSSPSSSEIFASLSMIHHKFSRRNRAYELLKKAIHADEYASAGFVYAAMGKLDKAFETFNKTNRWGAYSTPTIRYLFPDFLSELRKDNRFEEVPNNVNTSWEFT